MKFNKRNEVKKIEPPALWASPKQIGEILTESSYSVTSPDAIRKQYIKQVEQYPLYEKWLDWMIDEISSKLTLGQRKLITEYGSGPGLFAGKIKDLPDHEYVAIEPNQVFGGMTKDAHPLAKVIENTAESYRSPNSADIVCATATYHHFVDKFKALKNIYQNLKPGGHLLIGDVFLPAYKFDKNYNPADRQEFLDSNIAYAAKQILYMQNPDLPSIEDQLKTFILDTLRYEELKVCLYILLHQLKAAGFEDITAAEMLYKEQNIGWYKVKARKP